MEVVEGLARSVRVRRDALLVQPNPGWPRLECPSGVLDLPLLNATESQLLDRMLLADVHETGLEADLIEFIRLLVSQGWIERTVWSGLRALATLEPLAPGATLFGEPASPIPSRRLSRFTFFRTDADRAVVESSRSRWRVVLHDESLGCLLVGLAMTASEQRESAWSEQDEAVLDLLGEAHLLADDDEGSTLRLVQWNPIDLLFHSRSRQGQGKEPYGATFPLRERFDRPVAVVAASNSLTLPTPAVGEDQIGRTFRDVVESRRSIREHNEAEPITLESLAEFLRRSARICATVDQGTSAYTERSYPGGGAAYELEIYPVVRSCVGMDPGVYRYEPLHHGLVPVAPYGREARRLVLDAQRSTGSSCQPQILLVISARVGRVMWKYQSMAYSLVLKDVGVLLAHFYLEATALGLAPCAVGGGDGEAFARATGLDPYDEPSVGEFVLGTPAPTRSPS